MTISTPTKHTLLVPVTFEAREHTSITLRRIKGKDIRELAQQDDGDKSLFIIARLSGWPPEGVDELDAADIDEISKIVEGFTTMPKPKK